MSDAAFLFSSFGAGLVIGLVVRVASLVLPRSGRH
jgi:hypothetical protein